MRTGSVAGAIVRTLLEVSRGLQLQSLWRIPTAAARSHVFGRAGRRRPGRTGLDRKHPAAPGARDAHLSGHDPAIRAIMLEGSLPFCRMALPHGFAAWTARARAHHLFTPICSPSRPLAPHPLAPHPLHLRRLRARQAAAPHSPCSKYRLPSSNAGPNHLVGVELHEELLLAPLTLIVAANAANADHPQARWP